MDRFLNPFIKHYLIDIALNSTSKYKTRNLPSLIDYLKQKDHLPKRLVFSLAALILFYEGKRGDETIDLADDAHVLDVFTSAWNQFNGTKESMLELATKILSDESCWGENLNELPGLTELVADYLFDMKTKGIVQTLEEQVANF